MNNIDLFVLGLVLVATAYMIGALTAYWRGPGAAAVRRSGVAFLAVTALSRHGRSGNLGDSISQPIQVATPDARH